MFLILKLITLLVSSFRHFNLPDHKGLEDISIHVVDFIHAHPHGQISQRLTDSIEKNWQHRLQTTAPLGLNIDTAPLGLNIED